MIPNIIENESIYTNKLITLSKVNECMMCEVIEERNGVYDLKMKVPCTAKCFGLLQLDQVIQAEASQFSGLQLFRIFRISKPSKGVVTIDAHHISYDLTGVVVKPFGVVKGATSAFKSIEDNMVGDHLDKWSFLVNSDNKDSTFKCKKPTSVRSCFGGVKGSVLDTFGGEFEFDNFNVKYRTHRGTDRGVSIRYGKNLLDLQQEENIDRVYSHVLPFVYISSMNGKDEQYIEGDLIKVNDARMKVMPLDLSQEFNKDDDHDKELNITPNMVNEKAKQVVKQRRIGIPNISLKVKFVNLADTEEYKDIAMLERVGLCDVVDIKFSKLNVSAKAKVVRTNYNVLKEKFNFIELGNARTTLSSSIVESKQETEAMIEGTKDFFEVAIEKATDLINGGRGGYVVFGTNASGQREEIYIMDQPTTAQAINVIRMNKNGIGFSQTGFEGPFRSAWTIDGTFNADFINAGVLRSILIEAVNIVGSELKFGTDPNSITLKDNNDKTGCVFKGDGKIAMQSKGSQTFSNVDSDKTIKNQIVQWFDNRTKQIALKNYQKEKRLGNGVYLQSDDESNKIFVNNNSYDRENKISNYIQLNSQKGLNGAYMINKVKSTEKTNSLKLLAWKTNGEVEIDNLGDNKLSLKNTDGKQITLQNTGVNTFNMREKPNASINLINKGYFGNRIEMYCTPNYSGIEIANGDTNKEFNKVRFRSDSTTNAIDMFNNNKSGTLVNQIGMFSAGDWNCFRFDNRNSGGRMANQIEMESKSSGNAVHIRNYQGGANDVINGSISIRSSNTYSCQNWHDFQFVGDDPQFRVGGYQGKSSDVTLKNWDGKTIKLIFKYGLFVGYEIL